MRTHAVFILALAASPAFAAKPKAGRGPKEPSAAELKAESSRAAAHLERELSLTPEQTQKVSDILEDALPATQILRQRLMEHERRTREAIRAVLTDEQKVRFDIVAAERGPGPEPERGPAPRPRGRMQDRGPMPPPEHDGQQDDPGADRPGVMIDTGDEPPAAAAPPPRRKKR